MALNPRNLQAIRLRDPELGDLLDDMLGYDQNIANQVNASPTGTIQPPPNVSAVTVTAANGVFSAAITDSNPVVRGINYFLEYSETPSFNAPKVVDLGASRNWEGALGNRTLYFRGYSQYPTSARSAPVYHGSQTSPTAVPGGGTIAPPVSLPSQGSGTARGASGSDGGFGNNPSRGTPVTQAPVR
jgi:hypothetical protein